MPDAYHFEAELVDHSGVSRRVAVRGDQTLADLSGVLREAFEWWDDHLYSFWLEDEFWGDPEREYTSPLGAEPGTKTADVPLEGLGLQAGQEIAYVFDFGDEWRVLLRVAELTRAGEREEYPRIVERRGEAPPQYAPLGEADEPD